MLSDPPSSLLPISYPKNIPCAFADVDKVNALSSFAAAAAIFASFPAYEIIGGPKMPGTLWCIFLCALGKFALDGKVNPWVAVALWLVNGAQWYLAPDMIKDMYQIPPGGSVLATKMLSLQGGRSATTFRESFKNRAAPRCGHLELTEWLRQPHGSE